MPVEEQVISIFAGTNGYLDDLPVTDVKRFEQELLEVFHTRHGAMLEEIRTKGTLPDGVRDAVAAFKNDFAPGFGEAAIADPLATDADALGEAESDKTLATE
jgi:F-type H+-transporting ATPase subunit alpha